MQEESESDFSFDDEEKEEFHQYIVEKTHKEKQQIIAKNEVKQVVQQRIGHWAANIT